MKKRYWIAILCAILTLVLTVAAASADTGDAYKMVTDASGLHDGDRIILVSDDGSYYQAMATDFSGMQVTVTDNTITEQNGMLALTLTETEGGWLLASNDGYLAADGGALTIVSDSSDAAVWTISIASDGTATVSCTGGAIVFDEQEGAYRFFFGSGGNEIVIYNATFEAEQHPFGNTLWWSFANGKLTIGGSGVMPDFGSSSQPWNQLLSNITEVEIQNGVTSIGDYAFFNCTGLTKVTIPDSVTSIGWLALCGCTGLNEISIPNSVESIGTSAFSNTGWWNAQSNGVVYLDSALIGFKGSCGQILRVKDGTRLIADYAFNNQTQIKKITIPETVTSVGNRAFGGCTGLTSVTMPCSASADRYAFSGCTGITTVHLTNGTGVMPDNVAVWSDSRGNAMTVILDDGIQNISSYAFSGYTGLTSLTMPCSISIGEYAFRNCTGITTVHLTKGTGTMANYGYNNQYQNLPWYISRDNAITVTLDDGILNIGRSAFLQCTGLTEITIPDSVTSIGDYAFCNCTGLMQITIPDSVESIGIGAFYNTGWWNVQSDGIVYLDYILLGVKGSCEQIVQIKEGTRLIAGQAFYGHTEINKVMIPDRVTFIGDSAFYNCTGMNEIAIPNSVTFIGNSAFYKCKGMNEIAIPDNVTSVGNEMFYGCSGLTSVTIGNEVTSVGSGAFEDCTGLTEITIPDKVTYIGASAFRNCSGLMSITIPNGVTMIGIYTFYNCSMLSEIMIPNSITRIDQLTFTGCNRLTDVYYLGTEAQRQNIAIDVYYNDPLLNATWHYISDPPVFKTQSLVLADSIGVNFFVELPEINGIDWTESYMTFTIFGTDGCTDRCDYDPDFTNSKGYYGFTCYINAAQLADTITATFHYGPGLKVEKTYSVKEYLGTYDEYRSIFDPKTQAMIEALADYGHYVQAFLAAQKGWTYGVEHEEMNKSYTASYDIDTIKAAAADYAIVRVNESNGDVEKITYSMAVDSATAILVYFKPAADYSGTLTVKVNGEDYTATAVNGRYEVRIPDISAHQLGRTFTIVATTEHGTATAEVSALSYVAGSLNAYASVPLTANAMASIYRYAMAAEEYKN